MERGSKSDRRGNEEHKATLGHEEKPGLKSDDNDDEYINSTTKN